MIVQLRIGEQSRAISWTEPSFHSATHLKEVFKSKIPGDALPPGIHTIKYVAIDQDELSAICEFNITVNAYTHPKRLVPHHHQGQRINSGVVQQIVPANKQPTQTQPASSGQQPELGPTEAYVMCPNRVAMKLDTTFPVSSFRIFYKNIYQPDEAQAHVTSKMFPPEDRQPPPPPLTQSPSARGHANKSPTHRANKHPPPPPRHFIDIYHWVV